ncbi:hypothetical protein AAFJ72_16895 [Brevibacillus gelatini]|uniref:hypothetical protein n=1 Tax=Brevibacillus gelatini TaxID=1655277 RepID=UPI003D815393
MSHRKGKYPSTIKLDRNEQRKAGVGQKTIKEQSEARLAVVHPFEPELAGK